MEQAFNSRLCYALISLITGIAFYPAINNDFVFWDDQYYVTQNPFIRNPSWENLRLLMTKIISLNFHPLTMLSLWANSLFSGVGSAKPFIITNIIVHSLNALLVFKFIGSLFLKSKWMPLLGAIIFVVHPLHVESVIWVSERKDVLYTFFFLLAGLQYIKYLDDKNSRTYGLILLYFTLACLSKAMAVSLIPVLFLIDFIKEREILDWSLQLKKLPFICIAFLFGMIAINVQSGGDFYGFLDHTTTDKAIVPTDYSFMKKLMNASIGISFYLQKFILPFAQSAYHPVDLMIQMKSSFFNTLIPCGYFMILIYSYFKSKPVFFGLCFFLVTIALVLQLIPVGSAFVAERYTYLPYVGLGVLVGYIFDKLNIIIRKEILFIGLISITIPMIILTQTQAKKWKDHITLFSQSVYLYPDNIQARIYLANGYWAMENLDLAIYHVEYAINKLGSVASSSFELLANCYSDKGEIEKAIAFYKEALRRDENNVAARYHKAILIFEMKPEEAIADFNICEMSNNEYIKSLIYVPRGRAYGITGQYDKAIEDFSKAIELEPLEADNYIDRGTTYVWMGKENLANNDFEMAAQIDTSIEIN